MINTFAHLTPVEAPAGLLMFLAGCVVGAFAMSLARRFRNG